MFVGPDGDLVITLKAPSTSADLQAETNTSAAMGPEVEGPVGSRKVARRAAVVAQEAFIESDVDLFRKYYQLIIRNFVAFSQFNTSALIAKNLILASTSRFLRRRVFPVPGRKEGLP